MKLNQRPFAFISYKSFLENKKRSGTSPLDSFSAWLLKKSISLVIFYYLTKCHCLVVFTLRAIEQYMYCNCLLTRLWRHNFEINFMFLIKLFFLHGQKVKTKIEMSREQKELLRWNKNHFSNLLKGFHWRK